VNRTTIPTRLIELLDQVSPFLKKTGVPHRGINIAVYDGSGPDSAFDSEQGIPMEAGVEVVAAFEGGDGIVCSRTPAGPAATVTHIGPYDQIPRVHEAIRTWAKENRRGLTGINGEVYGHWTDDPNGLRTDVWYQLAS
jgi:effector-binding domain-containing protein